jgi:hypothetical protein
MEKFEAPGEQQKLVKRGQNLPNGTTVTFKTNQKNLFVEELKDAEEWENFLKAMPQATFFHSLKWMKVLKKTFSLPTFYLTVKDGEGNLAGVCPLFISNWGPLEVYESLPYSDYGGPIIKKSHIREASISLWRFLEKSSYENGIPLTKMLFVNSEISRFFKSQDTYVDKIKGVVEIDLKVKPPIFIWNKIFRHATRKRIRRFERDGFQVREARTRSDFANFLVTYYKNMEHIKAPTFSIKFFENVWNMLYPENFNVLLVEKRRTVGGIAFFKYMKSIYLTYLGIDREALSSRYRITPYVFWKAIKWAEEDGFRYVSLGATPSNPRSTYYSQKIMFGGSFLQQENVYVLFASSRSVFLLTMLKAMKLWNNLRNVVPEALRKALRRIVNERKFCYQENMSYHKFAKLGIRSRE